LAPHDLDVVPDPDRPDGLGAALEAWGVIRRPSLRALERDIVTVESAYGPIDLLLRRGREDFASLRRHATMADIAGVRLAIASAPECWALRRQFKGES
jgi:hypothetical protein